MNLYVYKRVSSSKQDKEGKNSLKLQVSDELITSLCTEYNLANVIELRPTVGSAYSGKHISEGSALSTFIEDCKQNLNKGILAVYSLDRLSRLNFSEGRHSILDPILRSGVRVYSYTDNHLFEWGDLKSSILADLIFSRANEESTTKSIRSTEAIDNAIKAWLTDRTFTPSLTRSPFWIDNKTGKVISEQLPVIRHIIESLLTGKGYKTIQASLKDEYNLSFTQSNLSKIKSNSHYLLGDKVVTAKDGSQTVLEGYYEAVCTKEEIVLLNKTKSIQKTKVKEIPLLSNQGFLYCKLCGKPYLSNVLNGSLTYYCCGNKKHNNGCNLNSVSAGLIERVVLLLTGDLLDQANTDIDLIELDNKITTLQEEVRELTARYKERKRASVLDLLEEAENALEEVLEERENIVNSNMFSDIDKGTLNQHYNNEDVWREDHPVRNKVREDLKKVISRIDISKHYTTVLDIANIGYFKVGITTITGEHTELDLLPMNIQGKEAIKISGHSPKHYFTQGLVVNELVKCGLLPKMLVKKGLHKSKVFSEWCDRVRNKVVDSGLYSTNEELVGVWQEQVEKWMK
ncbi:recombinase family protein [Vibrio sp. M250220]|uniref:recombinase family protein n=1 Tax=Vibrio sp. M250220 TaxID=3020894 RepID=UPI002F40CB98